MKYSRRLAGLVAVALISTPFVSSALTLDELNQQIASLLSQVAALQQKIASQPQVSVSTNTATTVSTSAPATSAYCPQLSRALSIGARGEDVSSLQQFLIGQQLLAADSATGFFGALTQSAVQNWQSSHGIVTSGDAATTGFGAVGARTRSLIALNCSISSVPTTTTITGSACRVANPPTSSCSTGWRPLKDGAGCTIAYDCATPLPTITPVNPTSCPLYSAPICGTGYTTQSSGIDSNNCQLPLRCVAIGNTTPYISLNAPTNAAQGSTITLTWNSWNAPSNSAVVLTTSAGRIAQGLGTSGTYSWKIPGSNCDNGNPPSCFTISDNPNVWMTTPGQTMQVYAQIYTPAGASLGGGLLAPSPDLVYVAKSSVAPLTINGSSANTSFTASPTSGAAPLAVTVTRKQSASWCSASQPSGLILRPADIGSTAIDFGDGSAVERFDDCAMYKTHTYLNPGSYTIQSWGYGGFLPQDYVVQKTQVAVITVSGAVAIPQSVQAKYNVIAGQYGNSLGASLRSCAKGSSQIYLVTGSGGFSGETHYYNNSGVLMASLYSNDTPPFQTGTAPVNISEYSCTVLQTNSPQSN